MVELTEPAPEEDLTGALMAALSTLETYLANLTEPYAVEDAELVTAIKQTTTLVPLLLEDYGVAWEVAESARALLREQALPPGVERSAGGIILP